MSFWKELKRRNVYKVGIAYLIVAWLIVQAAAIVFPHLNLPTWAVTLVIVLLIIGFPLALLLAWAYEVTPDGIKRTKQVPLSESIRHLTGQKLNYIVTGLLVLAVAFLVIDTYLIDRHAVEQDLVSTETAQAPSVVSEAKTQKTIAVLPFVDISPEKDQEYFVDGLSEELLNTLAQIPDLTVIARTSSFSFKGTTKKVQEIANELGVDNILEGSVRKAGDALRITAQLVKGVDGSHLWSKTYDRELKDIFAVQEDIATAVASELKVALGVNKSLKQLGGTENEKAYELYMIAKGYYRTPPTVDRALESINEALALDPEFALAWALKAAIQQGRSALMPNNLMAIELNEGINAAQKAIELEPDLAEGYHSLGVVKTSMGDWIEAELAFRSARERITEISLRYEVEYPPHYMYVGHHEKAIEILEGLLRNDPLNSVYHGFLINCLLGDRQQLEEEYERVVKLFGDQDSGLISPEDMIFMARLFSGDAISLDYIDDITYFGSILDTVKEHLDSPEEGLSELQRIYHDENNLSFLEINSISSWAAYFGDPELSMDAMEKAFSINSLQFIYSPLMKEVRQLPRFKEFVREIGLVDYWEQFGWPEICHQLDNGDFECD